MKILAIDPGPETSAWVLYDPGAEKPIVGYHNGEQNEALRRMLGDSDWWGAAMYGVRLAIEMVASYGMPVGMSTFETCVWVGRFLEGFSTTADVEYDWRVYRSDVKAHICRDSRAKDANIRRALLDRFPAGKKSAPGPSYGLSGDGFSALAVAVTVAEGGVRHKTIAEQVAAQKERRAKRVAARAA